MSTPGQSATAAVSSSPLGSLPRRIALYSVWCVALGLLFFAPLARLFNYALSNDNASHAILIPAICVWILFLERSRIFVSVDSDIRSAAAFLVSGALAGL